ncbi:aspartate aminotransferase family protein [Veillonella rodentium]|uniref:Acetylornithine aminotransferase n=1 Tax=Veillonella rodentium TaxID=248315 RepID=A0A239ZJ66_9FIRM|nr:aspartate aminotransferase family protein [Veillonella rodentium]SNV70768.1 Acetylornithine aminotransferase [Veillonella rodentium]
MNNTTDFEKQDKEYIANTYGRFNVCFEKGKGSLLWDVNGKEYIDLGSGIGVTAFGVDDEEWSDAVTKQAHALNHVSNLYHTLPQIELAKQLCAKTGMKKVFFSNSGAESNECAIKAARKYSHDTYGDGRNVIVTLVNSFHGRTVTTLSATGQDVFHQHFFPFTEGFVHTPANDIEAALEVLSNPNVCAIMMEPIQGEGGVMPLDAEFVQAVTKYAHEHDQLVLIDEVQTGNGRTGTLYAYEQFGIEPDIVSTAKGLAGGLPMGATLFNEKTQYVLTAGAHATTFGGNPICAAAGNTIISRLTPEFLKTVKAKGDYVKSALAGKPGIVDVSGMGLMLGIETTVDVKDVILKCLERGVVVLSAKNKVRLLPALNIPQEQLEKAVAVVADVIESLSE